MANKRNLGRKKARKFYGKKKNETNAQLPATEQKEAVNSENYGFVLFSFTCLSELILQLACPECLTVGSVSLCFVNNKKSGLAVCMKLACSACGYNSHELFSSPKVCKYFEINRRMVYASREIGCGHSSMNRLCYLLGLPSGPNKNAYQAHIKEINKVVTQVANETMNNAAEEVRTETGSSECAVSVDGSWQRRGFSSLTGVVSAMSVKTGKVLDVEVMSKSCMSCRKHSIEDKNSLPYQAWLAEHTCSSNYKGSSPNMEPIGAGRIFLRSVQNRGLLYTQYLGDGDSKSHKTVSELDPYNGKEIVKLECVGHYQKRLGKALRQLVKDKKLGGKGKLTQALIDKLQNYFGIALRSNTESVDKMHRAIWASMFHVSANDSQPLHAKCPLGEDSWCNYQVAKARGIPYTHKGPGIPIEIIRQIKPVYERLTDKKMLQKCLHGKTQNTNESFNGMIWKRCPKETYVGHTTVNLCVMDAVCHYNRGPEVQLDILKKMGIDPGFNTTAGVSSSKMEKETGKRKHATPEVKSRRRYLRGRKKIRIDQQTAKEGVTYDAGGF